VFATSDEPAGMSDPAVLSESVRLLRSTVLAVTAVVLTTCRGVLTRSTRRVAALLAGQLGRQVARAGGRAVLYEMRPLRQTAAHKTGDLAELVCSNSLKSESESSAPWLLKEELRRLDWFKCPPAHNIIRRRP